MQNSRVDVQKCENGVRFLLPQSVCRIEFITDAIIRIKYSFSAKEISHPSFAVLIPNSDNGGGEIVNWEFIEEENTLTLKAAKIEARVTLDPFAVTLYDAQERLLHQDLEGAAYGEDLTGFKTHRFVLDTYTDFYGFGEKSGALNKFHKRMRMYSCDAIGYDAEYSDPLYKHIPFFIKRSQTNGAVCGVFYDATEEGVFDIGCERSGYWVPYASYASLSDILDIYMIAADSIPQAVRLYTDLTGKTAFPPLQTLGFIASTMYFTEREHHADDAILSFIRNMMKFGFGCDAYHLSSGYSSIAERRYVFTWNQNRFPDPGDFVNQMGKMGICISPNMKPAMLTDHPLYDEFAQEKAFIINKTTGKPFVCKFWGGDASYIDFSSADGQRMWKKYLNERVLSLGISAVWNDNNEYEMLSDVSAVASGEPAKPIKPVFANLMAETAWEAISAVFPERRPYILSRGGYAGIQRYAQTWAGDNNTSWQSLKYNIPIILGMGLSGVANQGCDIGGFFGPAPDAELFVRWIQNGIFQPRFCIHSCNNDNTVTLPWSYEGYTDIVRRAFEMRYQFGIYMYALLRYASKYGDPIMRAMVYEFEQDPMTACNSFDFMFGPFVLVANVLDKGAATRKVYLPKDCFWFDWYTHQCYSGGQIITVQAPLDKIPMFYRSGSIIPLANKNLRMSSEIFSEIHLLIEGSCDTKFSLYQDDGASNGYLNGEYLETCIYVCHEKQSVDIHFDLNGKDIHRTDTYIIEFHDRDIAPANVSISGVTLEPVLSKNDFLTIQEGIWFDLAIKHLWIKIRNKDENAIIHINYDVVDLIKM